MGSPAPQQPHEQGRGRTKTEAPTGSGWVCPPPEEPGRAKQSSLEALADTGAPYTWNMGQEAAPGCGGVVNTPERGWGTGVLGADWPTSQGPAHLKGPLGGGSSWLLRPEPQSLAPRPDLQGDEALGTGAGPAHHPHIHEAQNGPTWPRLSSWGPSLTVQTF